MSNLLHVSTQTSLSFAHTYTSCVHLIMVFSCHLFFFCAIEQPVLLMTHMERQAQGGLRYAGGGWGGFHTVCQGTSVAPVQPTSMLNNSARLHSLPPEEACLLASPAGPLNCSRKVRLYPI